MPLPMAQRRRTLLDSALGGDIAGGLIEDVRARARQRVLKEVDGAVGGVVRDRIDQVLGRERRRR